MIRAVGVVVPVHDEEMNLPRCLAALARACRGVPSGVETRVTIVLDTCRDGSERIARRAVDGVVAEVSVIEAANVGRARAAGVGQTLDRFAHHAEDEVWLAMTDADSVVPPHWLAGQLALAERHHASGIAGTVAVDEWESFSPERISAYERFYEKGGLYHPHVHGANLGVRADSYRAVGGFAPLETGEDVALWSALSKLPRARLVKTRTLPVVTSGRLRGRAPKGFAGFLASFRETA